MIKNIQNKIMELFEFEEINGMIKISTPFALRDGDCITLLLRITGETWELTDGRDTAVCRPFTDQDRLTVNGILEMFEVRECDGELIKETEQNTFGRDIVDFIQCILKVDENQNHFF